MSDVTSAHVTSSWSRLLAESDPTPGPHRDMSPNDTHYAITTQQSANIATAMVQCSGRYWPSVISPESQFRVGLNIYWGPE